MDIEKEMQEFSSHIMSVYGEHVLWNDRLPIDLRHRGLWNLWHTWQAAAEGNEC